MLEAFVDGIKRAPLAKGERAVCRDCGALLIAVVPVENLAHWRHKGGDCDPWSEPESAWHIGWKRLFPSECREISLSDQITQERHRADVLCGQGSQSATVLELQHSSIGEDERDERETFYRREHRMFWLIHIHGENSFLDFNFSISMDFGTRQIQLNGKTFAVMQWMGRSSQFIEKWKRAKAHVFFDWREQILYLASESVSKQLGGPFKRGEFALCKLTRAQFIQAVRVGV